MEETSLHADVTLYCYSCGGASQKIVPIYSERLGHFGCATCKIPILDITFKFKMALHTSLEIQMKASWDCDFCPSYYLFPGDSWQLSISCPNFYGHVKFSIDCI